MGDEGEVNMAKKLRKGKDNKPVISAERKMQLSDLITIKRTGNVSLKHNPNENFWVVTLGYQRTYTYKSSTWAQNKYRRLLIVNGIIDEDSPLAEEEGELCEKQY
jgi:hypothetical protein